MPDLLDSRRLHQIMQAHKDSAGEIGPQFSVLGVQPLVPHGEYRHFVSADAALLAEHVPATPADLIPPEVRRPDGHPSLGGDFLRNQAVEAQDAINVDEISLESVQLAAEIDHATGHSRPLLLKS